MHQLMALELGRLDKGLATLGTDVHSGPVCVLVFAHRRIVTEHFRAALVRAGNCPDWILVSPFLLGLHSVNNKTTINHFNNKVMRMSCNTLQILPAAWGLRGRHQLHHRYHLHHRRKTKTIAGQSYTLCSRHPAQHHRDLSNQNHLILGGKKDIMNERSCDEDDVECKLPSSSVPDAHIVTENSPSSVLIWTCFCSHLRLL